MFTNYIVKNKKIVPVDADTWAQWITTPAQETGRIVHQEEFKQGKDTIWVSTVFSGSWEGDLFETNVFRNGDTEDSWRTKTWEEAEAKHKEVVKNFR